MVFPVNGTAAEVSIVMTTMGQHWLQYYSIDKAGNKETLHSETAGIARPELADLLDIIENSNIDNDGIKNALSAKVRAAQHHLDMGHSLNTLKALMNQLDAIEGKHGLDSETVRSILAIIAVMMP